MTVPDTPVVPLLAVAGFLLGTAYFAALRRTVGLVIARHAWAPYAASALVRVLAAVLVFSLAARWSVPALLAAFAGFLLARQRALRAARRPA